MGCASSKDDDRAEDAAVERKKNKVVKEGPDVRSADVEVVERSSKVLMSLLATKQRRYLVDKAGKKVSNIAYSTSSLFSLLCRCLIIEAPCHSSHRFNDVRRRKTSIHCFRVYHACVKLYNFAYEITGRGSICHTSATWMLSAGCTPDAKLLFSPVVSSHHFRSQWIWSGRF